MRGGTHQFAANPVGALFHWDFRPSASRMLGTGYAEDLRITPQTHASHSLTTAFRLTNTWYFGTKRVHHTNRPTIYGAALAGSSFIEQHGLCVVTTIDDATEINHVDEVLKVGFATLTGADITMGAIGFAKGKMLVQRVNGVEVARGYLLRNDGGYGYTHSLAEVTGTFQVGPADAVDSTGLVQGQVSITRTGVYSQVSEAIQFGGGSACVNVNYFVKLVIPATAIDARVIDVQLTDGHMAFCKSVLSGRGWATLAVGAGFNCQPVLDNSIAFDINDCVMLTMQGCNSTTNDGHTAGTKNYTFVKLRNVNGACIMGNALTFYDVPFDVDNTVKDAVIAFNSDTLNTCGPIKNTANRYGNTSTRGVRYYGNGTMGRDVDINDTRRQTWTPTVTSQFGSIGNVLVNNAYFQVGNGLVTFAAKITVVDRGSASGTMKISGPKLPSTTGPVNLGYDFLANASATSSVALVCVYSNVEGAFILHSDVNSVLENPGTDDAFTIAGTPGSYVYFIQGSAPIQFN